MSYSNTTSLTRAPAIKSPYIYLEAFRRQNLKRKFWDSNSRYVF